MALLLSRFFNPLIPPLHTSAYLAKKVSSASVCTTVDNLIFLSLFSFDLPFVALIISGSGSEVDKSGKVVIEVSDVARGVEESCVPYVTVGINQIWAGTGRLGTIIAYSVSG